MKTCKDCIHFEQHFKYNDYGYCAWGYNHYKGFRNLGFDLDLPIWAELKQSMFVDEGGENCNAFEEDSKDSMTDEEYDEWIKNWSGLGL